MASLFLQPEQVVFTIRGRNEQKEQVHVPAGPALHVSRGGADERQERQRVGDPGGRLQDHDRATILGEPSYGKGIVQNVFPLSGNSGLALTIAFYYTPSGRSLQKPLESGSLNVAAKATPGTFHTDAGREVRGGGGIQPDVLIQPAQVSQLVYVLDASGTLTAFAGEYVQSHDIPDNFDVIPIFSINSKCRSRSAADPAGHRRMAA